MSICKRTEIMLWHFGNSKIESWKGCKRTTVKLYARLLVLCPLDITEDFRIYLFYCEKFRKTEFIPKLREFAAYLRNELPITIYAILALLYTITASFGKHSLRHLSKLRATNFLSILKASTRKINLDTLPEKDVGDAVWVFIN